MLPITLRYVSLALPLLASSVFFETAQAATPAGQDQLRIHTGMPRRAADALFSYIAEWHVDNDKSYHANGMSFLNAGKIDNPEQVAKKLHTAMKDGMTQLYPNWRGITVEQTPEQPELTITNKAGSALTTVTVKDYSNMAVGFDVAGKNFGAAGVQVGIDLVYSAEVEYLDNFTAKKDLTASQGEIQLTFDGQPPIQIKTDGKTTRELEQELAKAIGSSHLSNTPLYTETIGKDKRNNKPFDGNELQLQHLAAKSITIDVNDPALGVLVKFKFKDAPATAQVAEPRATTSIVAVLAVAAAGFFWQKNRKKPA